ncbi:MAG TPA: nitroreductase family protein [Candidatus Aminicenantes bacterium]|nr:nitroreductase family protein [Candidatus Aminicenantes bacterium]HRY65322.1 nitroreductase family protein [Candidatus Aminicenantes bacterium]HRZ72210.1 nitroreductase family protein [Candidatus Aminicenantes bacterium]
MSDEKGPLEATPFQRILQGRRSIRRFLPAPVEPEKLRACLEAARLAPSAHNVQPWRFMVVDDPDLKSRLAAAAFGGFYKGSLFAAQAPVILVLLARPGRGVVRLGSRIQGVPFFLLDMGIAGEHLVLQAEELGLATCWMGWFNYRRVRKALDIPPGFKLVALMPLGYAEKRPRSQPPRRTLEGIAAFNKVPPE